MARTERLVFDWQRSRSEASHRGWEGRWERGEAVGLKGKAYLDELTKEGPRYFEEEREYDDFDDVWDFEGEY